MICRPCPTRRRSVREHHLAPDVSLAMVWEGAHAVDPAFLQLGDGSPQHLQFGCCLVRVRGTNVLLDTACGTVDFERSFSLLPAPLPHALLDTLRDDFGVAAEDVHVVVHSHLHADHIGNNVVVSEGGVLVPAFPNAVHCVRRDEWEYATTRFAHGGECPWRAVVERKFEPLRRAGMLRLLDKDGAVDARVPEVTLVHTPGHTPGHAAVRVCPVSSTGRVAYYVGDALHVPRQVECPTLTSCHDCCGWRGRAAWRSWPLHLQVRRVLGGEWAPTTAAASRRALLMRIAAEGALLVSPHFPEPGVGTLGARHPDGGWAYAPFVS